MSRFADPKATRTVQLGPCECLGTPHTEGDWAKIRSDLSGADIASIANLASDDEEAAADGMAPYIAEWNLLGVDGKPWAPSGESLLALHQDTMTLIVEGITAAVTESLRLPNPLAAPSPASSRGSGSRTRTTRARTGT